MQGKCGLPCYLSASNNVGDPLGGCPHPTPLQQHCKDTKKINTKIENERQKYNIFKAGN